MNGTLPVDMPEQLSKVNRNLLMLKRLLCYPVADVAIPHLSNNVTLKGYKDYITQKIPEGMDWSHFENPTTGWTIDYINNTPLSESDTDLNELLKPENIKVIMKGK